MDRPTKKRIAAATFNGKVVATQDDPSRQPTYGDGTTTAYKDLACTMPCQPGDPVAVLTTGVHTMPMAMQINPSLRPSAWAWFGPVPKSWRMPTFPPWRGVLMREST